jgi:SAM-dependent methyltransferase
MKINIHTIYRPFLKYFRTKRMLLFEKYFRITPETKILDVGGTDFNWSLLRIQPKLTFLNLTPPRKQNPADTWLVADGCNLPFPDKAFDIVYSNSVIEHLGSFENQRLFAAECLRVGCQCYIQTPNKNFFIEPHLLTPFIHWLPSKMRERLLRNFTVWGLLTRPSKEACHDFVKQVFLLGQRDLEKLFPNTIIQPEKVFGITKSFEVIVNG